MLNLTTSLMPHAVAVALSPIPIAALILLLLSNRPKANSIGFLLGWLIGLFLTVFVSALIFSQPFDSHSGKTLISRILSGVLGLLLLFFALKEWKSRTKPGEEAKMPSWMKTIESFTPLKSFFIGALIVAVNAKNTVLDITAGVTIAQKTNSSSELLTTTIIYTIIASLTIIIPVLGFIVFGGKLNNNLNSTKIWLIQNNAAVLFVLFLILGVSILSKAF